MAGGGYLGGLDLSPGGLLRSGSSVVLLALAILLWSRRSAHPWNRRLAIVYGVSALGGFVYNVIGGNTAENLQDLSSPLAGPALLFTMACSIVAGILLWSLTLPFLNARRSRVAGAIVGGPWVLMGLTAVVFSLLDWDLWGLEGSTYLLAKLTPTLVGLVASAEGARDDAPGATRFWAVSLPFWAEAMLYVGVSIHDSWAFPGLLGAIAFAALYGTRLLATLWGLRAAAVSRTVLLLALATLAIAAVGAVLGAQRASDLGVSGILLVSAKLGTLFLLRHLSFFGAVSNIKIPLSRGTIASLGLAVLFITAQVAQNFFSAEVGLYWGGAMAGIVVFAAHPLQKLAERATERRPAPPGPSAFYRHQVETAWQDGRLGANERVMLRDLRQHLGLSAEHAEAIDNEVAGQHVSHGRDRN